MKITWLGHAAFCVESENYMVVLDPYTDVRGYPELRTEGHEVLCSHEHHDHHYLRGVSLLPKRPSPFRIETMATFHDEQQGALRGSNTVHILRCGEGSVVHLGDLGHPLSAAQAERLRGCDVLMIPVGGVYTVDAASAKEICTQLAPRITVPMHYRHDPYGLDHVAAVEDFLRLFPVSEVHRLNGGSFDASGQSGVVVPHFGK